MKTKQPSINDIGVPPWRALQLAAHITAMADDAYLSGHPEWNEILTEARAVMGEINPPAVTEERAR